MRKAIYTSACAVLLTFALTGCEGALTPSSHPASASPLPPLSPTPSSTLTQEPTPTPFREESPDELDQVLAPTATPTPLFPSTFPDLVPPPGGWIAFRTPEGHLALISSDASRFIPLTEQGEVTFAWSPDGHWLAFIINLGGSTSYQLALVSIESSCLISLTRPGAVATMGFTWSQDSCSLAYLYNIDPEKEKGQSPQALRLLDLSTHQVITLTTYSNTRPDDSAYLCPQAFPSPLLAVKIPDGPLQIWDTRAGKMVVELGPVHSCYYCWLPEERGMILSQVELDVFDKVHGREVDSLAFWTVGGEASVVALRGTEEQYYLPVRWLSDGQLVVQVARWEKEEESEQPAQLHVEHQLFYVNEGGELQKVEGSDLPWWTAGGFRERLAAARLPQSISPAISRLSGWEVGPDEETVIFTWRWVVDEESKSAIYLWRGEGEPMRLSMGEYPRWQPKVPIFSPTPSLP